MARARKSGRWFRGRYAEKSVDFGVGRRTCDWWGPRIRIPVSPCWGDTTVRRRVSRGRCRLCCVGLRPRTVSEAWVIGWPPGAEVSGRPDRKSADSGSAGRFPFLFGGNSVIRNSDFGTSATVCGSGTRLYGAGFPDLAFGCLLGGFGRERGPKFRARATRPGAGGLPAI